MLIDFDVAVLGVVLAFFSGLSVGLSFAIRHNRREPTLRLMFAGELEPMEVPMCHECGYDLKLAKHGDRWLCEECAE